MNTPVLHKTSLPLRIGIVVICLSICYFAATAAFAADEIALSGLSGSNGFVFAGTSADDIDWDFPAGSGGPHGGYQTTSSKCITCHSTHGAVASDIPNTVAGARSVGMTINRSSTGCAFCHTLGAPAAPNGTPDTPDRNPSTEHVWVYNATAGQTDRGAFDTVGASGHSLGEHAHIPASSVQYPVVLACSTCHLVHGGTANAWKPEDARDNPADPTSVAGYKFLRDNPSGGLRATTDTMNVAVPTTASAATTLYQNLLNDSSIDITDLNQYTLSFWCANCHDYAFQPQPVPEDNPTLFDDDAFTVTGGYLAAVHANPGDNNTMSETLADGYLAGYGHRSPIQGATPLAALPNHAGTMECYSCHRAGLSVEGVADASELATSFPGYSAAFAVPGDGECAPCHYGYVNYAVDANRFGTPPASDFPHTSADDVKMLGDFTMVRNTPDEMGTPTVVSNWSSLVGASDAPNPMRAAVCGRCHSVVDSGVDGGPLSNEPWIEFARSYHGAGHQLSSSWLLNPIFGGGDLYSPGVGTP